MRNFHIRWAVRLPVFALLVASLMTLSPGPAFAQSSNGGGGFLARRIQRVRQRVQNVRDGVATRVERVQRAVGLVRSTVTSGVATTREAVHTVTRQVEIRPQMQSALDGARSHLAERNYRRAMSALLAESPVGLREQSAHAELQEEIVRHAVSGVREQLERGSLQSAVAALNEIPRPVGLSAGSLHSIRDVGEQIFDRSVRSAVEASGDGDVARTREALAVVDHFRANGPTLEQLGRLDRAETRILHNLVRSGWSVRRPGELRAGFERMQLATSRYGRERVARASITVAGIRVSTMFGRAAGNVASDVAVATRPGEF